MKKTATLVAGLLLVTGTVFAASNLDFSGSTIKAKTIVVQRAGADLNDDSDDDTDYNLNLKYTLDDKTSATFTYLTDDENTSNPDGDNVLGIKVKRTEGNVEAQIKAELNTATGTTFQEDTDSSDTYVKWNQSKDLSLTFYPYNMGLANGSMFGDSDNYTEIPGVVLTNGNYYVGAGIDSAKDTTVKVAAVKAGYTYSDKLFTINTKYSGVFFDADRITGANANLLNAANGGALGYVTQDINVSLNYKLSPVLALDAEVGVNILEKDTLNLGTTAKPDYVNSGFGAIAKVTYAMSDVLAPYGQFKYTTDGYLAYGDMEDFNTPSSGSATKTGGLLELSAGTNYQLAKGLTLNGDVTAKVTGEKIYNGKDNNLVVSSYVKYTF